MTGPVTAAEFLMEFGPDQFPSEFGPWITRDQHDPMWTMAALRAMARQGIIELSTDGTYTYRLTLKATRVMRGEA